MAEKKQTRISKIKDRLKGIFSTKKRIVMIGGGFALFLALALGSWLFFFSGSDSEEDQKAMPEITKEGTLTIKEEVVFEDIVDLDPFERIHLRTGSTMKLVDMKLALELTDHRYRKQVISMQEQIRKVIISQVGVMNWIQLRNPEGKLKLKYAMIEEINGIFPQATVRNVYFTNLIMY